MTRHTVLIADDHALLRMGLRSLLEAQEDFAVVGEADDGELAVSAGLSLKPDVIIMDYMMPRLDGATAAKRILVENPSQKILILTSYGSANGISEALQAGVAGALLKNDDNREIVDSLRKIIRGEQIVSPEIQRLMEESPSIEELSARQLEILELITHGLTNAEIANIFSIQEDTVKKHVNAVFERIGATNRAEAVAIALRKHLLKI